MSQTAKETLKEFSTQKMQLQKFIDKMTHWLTETEETLLRCSRNLDPESLNLVKVSAEESEYTSILMRWTSFFVGIFTS